ncbi:High-affinity branched-chain amino acid transport ATP-binding protein LivF [Candidatus Entotheonellaceae bacterium PAL068K]
MLALEQLNVFYGSMHILHDVTLRVDAGEIVALLGRNGVGKTTTLRSIMGLTPPRSGTIAFQHHDLTRLPPHRLARLGIGYVLQSPHVFPRLSVQENLRLGLPSQQLQASHFDRIFVYFPVLRQRLSQAGGTLSGGEQQMLAFARVLLANPDLMLLDEPTEGLMPQLARRVEETIRRVNQQEGKSILLVEQNVDLALRVSDRIYMMEKGEIVFAGRTAEVTEGDILRHMGVALE